jgi:hypothetical protein
MPKVRYIGPFIDGVLIPYGLGEITALHGEPVEVPDDLAAGLLDQPTNWEAVPSATKREKVSDE